MIRPGMSKISRGDHTAIKDTGVDLNRKKKLVDESGGGGDGVGETDLNEFVFKDPELYAIYVRFVKKFIKRLLSTVLYIINL